MKLLTALDLFSYLVDDTPIRVFKNLQSQGLAYPSSQQTGAYSTLFEASSWATQGGTVPIDWSAAPFIATFGGFQLEACANDGTDVTACQTEYQNNWWEGSQYTDLTASQISNLQYIRQTYGVYDYCTDTARNPTPPLECSYNY
jgi:xyloglucan:xyloglucosyl transferase